MTVMSSTPQFEPGSFRDPDTKVFHHDGAVFRCLTERGLADWTRLAATDFYARFTADGRLIPTEQVVDRAGLPNLGPRWVAVLEHQRVPMISYPYEWSFRMLQDAALLQLDLALAALDEVMTLKDATPFNIQWLGSRPTFIDVGVVHGVRAGRAVGPVIGSSASSFSIRCFCSPTGTSRSTDVPPELSSTQV